MDKILQKRKVNMLSNLEDVLREQFKTQKFCDITLTTTNQNSKSKSTSSVECHKIVLAATTKHFEHYLNSRENRVNTIDVSPIPAHTLKEILVYLYNGECLIIESNVCALLDTANTWVIPELVEDCWRFIASAKSIDNACRFYESQCRSDNRYRSWELCIFIRENFTEVYENKEIACLSLASFNDVIRITPKVDNHEIIFDAALLVIANHSEAVNHEDLVKCWQLMPFKRMSIPYLVNTVMYHELIRDSPQKHHVIRAVSQLSRRGILVNKAISLTRKNMRYITNKDIEDDDIIFLLYGVLLLLVCVIVLLVSLFVKRE